MPEGHTLHRLAEQLTGTYAGRLVAATSPQGRFEAGARRVDGRRFDSAEAVGKHLLIGFADLAETVHVHLGLYGSLTILPGSGRPVVGQVRLRIDDGAHTADLRGPSACGLLEPGEVEALMARLGPDPLRADADPAVAWRRIGSSRTPIATLLMNQEVVAGVGNVYRAEVLFRLGLDPYTPGRELSREMWDAIWADLSILMREGVKRGRIDTVRPEHEPTVMGREPRMDDHGGEVYVYRRDGRHCHICGADVHKATLGGRNLFWCPVCQQRR